MKNKYIFVLFIGLPLLLSACIPYGRSRPAYADLCDKKPDIYTITENGKQRTFELHRYLYNTKRFWSDERIEQSHFTIKPNIPPHDWKAPPEFYVTLILIEKHKEEQASHLPVYYDASQASVTMNDGRVLKAYPELFLSTRWDTPMEAPQFRKIGLVDLNDSKLNLYTDKESRARQIHKGSGSVNVVFPISDIDRKFDADAKWTVHLGSIKILDQHYAISDLKTCHISEKKWVGIEPLMRP